MLRVRTNMTGASGAPWLSTMFFDGSTGTIATAAVAEVNAFWTAVKAHVSTPTVILSEPDVAIIDPATGQQTGVIAVATTPVSGSGASTLPFANQIYVVWHTGAFINGRELIGKTFIPGPPTTDNNSGQVLGTAVTAVQNAAGALIASFGATFGIYSRTHHQFHGATASVTPNKFGVLRSRRD